MSSNAARMDVWRALGLASLLASGLLGQSVSESQGSIYLTEPGGLQRRLTSSGQDFDASLSPDGRTVAFARKTPGSPCPLESDCLPATTLWTVNLSERPLEPRLVFSGPVRGATGEAIEPMFTHLFSPQLSPNGRYLYFLVNYSTTSNAIYRFDLKTKKAEFISTGNGYRIVASGHCQGFLIASIRKSTLSLRIFYWYWLLTPEGKEVGLIGPDDADADSFQDAQDLAPCGR
jgi:hypothetical protein